MMEVKLVILGSHLLMAFQQARLLLHIIQMVVRLVATYITATQ